VADFDDSLPADVSASPARCQLPEASPLRREWTVVTVSDSRAAVVSAWEVPSRTAADVVFESVISTHRPAALAAARVLAAVAEGAGARPPAEAAGLLADATPRPATAAADVDRMWLRALARLD
jgi:hypothetical protein